MDADDWFAWWVAVYVKTTGSNADVAALLVENQGVFTRDWRVTREELDECADRLIREGRVPQFPNQHTNAIHRELVRLREERAVASRPAAPGDFAPDCPACGGSGIATIPHKFCVLGGTLVRAKSNGQFMTAAAICDYRGCVAGRAINDGSGLPLLSRVNGYHKCDVVALLRRHERAESEAVRRADFEANPLTALMDRILVRLGGDNERRVA